jgi:hypothetical protein
MTAQAASETEEARAPITQVVEVVEEEIVSPVSSPSTVPEDVPPVPEEEPTSESEIRKEKVEELYQEAKESRVMPEISVHKNKPIASLFVWAIVTILVAILTGGILFAAAKKTSPIKLFARPTPTPTASPASTPTPTPATIDKASFDIEVFNGGGTPGAAGKMKTFLEDKGYKVASTGNTAEYTYTTTEIHGKTTMKDAIANLEADLKDTYTLGTVAADLTASVSADVQVIVGK